jgi:hypothetical protein
MRLICYPTSGEPPKLIPAPFERDWMDRTRAGFAYRCLPLNIANAHGWLILNPVPFTAHSRVTSSSPSFGPAHLVGNPSRGKPVKLF